MIEPNKAAFYPMRSSHALFSPQRMEVTEAAVKGHHCAPITTVKE